MNEQRKLNGGRIFTRRRLSGRVTGKEGRRKRERERREKERETDSRMFKKAEIEYSKSFNFTNNKIVRVYISL